MKVLRINLPTGLLVVIGLGLVLRLSGIPWGAPPLDVKHYHPDEGKVILAASTFPKGAFSRQDLRYPNALHHGIGLLSSPFRHILAISGDEAYTFTLLLGRLVQVLLGTGCIFLAFRIGQTVYDDLHGWLAAALTAFSMLHMANSAWVTTDVAASFLLTLYILSLIRAYQQRSVKFAVLSGISLGLAVGTKYTAAIAVVPAIYLAITQAYRSNSGGVLVRLRACLVDRLLWTSGLISIVVFILSTPSIVTEMEVFITSIDSERARMQQMAYGKNLVRLILIDLYAIYVVSSPGMMLAFLASLPMVTVNSRSRYELAVLLPVLMMFVYFYFALLSRYLILILPLMAVLSTRPILALGAILNKRHRALGSTLIGLVVLQAFAFSLWGALSRYPDSRSLATVFIERNLPRNTSIGLAYGVAIYDHEWRYPRIDQTRFNLVDAVRAPDYIVTSSFTAEPIQTALASGMVSADDNYHVSERDLDFWYRRSPPSPEVFALYDELYFTEASRYTVIKVFQAEHPLAPIEGRSPRIEIFKKIDADAKPPSDKRAF